MKDLVIPNQNIEDKLTYVAEIKDVFPNASADFDNAFAVCVLIKNINTLGHSIVCRAGHRSTCMMKEMIYNRNEFHEFMWRYCINDPKQLIGKPVISIYDGPILSGLIPL